MKRRKERKKNINENWKGKERDREGKDANKI